MYSFVVWLLFCSRRLKTRRITPFRSKPSISCRQYRSLMLQEFASFFMDGHAQPNSSLYQSARTMRTAFSATLKHDPSGAVKSSFAYAIAS